MRRALTSRVLGACLALISAALASGCAPVVVGGTAVGASVIHDRRPTATLLKDQRIEMIARSRYDKAPQIANHSRIAATSYNRVVLLTGQAETWAVRKQYAELVSRIPEVRKVVDQVTVGPSESLQRESQDAYLTSRVKVALASVGLPDFDPTRVKVVTEAGTVHLMGLLTPAEAEAVVEKVRYVPGVVQVVELFEPYDLAGVESATARGSRIGVDGARRVTGAVHSARNSDHRLARRAASRSAARRRA